MKKVFVSQPMRGKTQNEIFETRAEAAEKVEEFLGEKVLVIGTVSESYDPEDGNEPLKYLAKALQTLADADIAFFCKGWEKARGCRIEYICANEYGIPVCGYAKKEKTK